MTVPTQPVSGKLADFGGASVAGVIVTAKLSDVDYTADGTFVSTEPVTTVTDASGNFVLNVFPNAVAPTGLGTRGTVLAITARPPNSKAIRVEAVIPNAPCNLVDHLVSEEQNGLNGSERAAFDAQAARDKAKQWATKTDAEVEVGQGYGAKKYAQDADADAQQTALDRIATGQDRQQTGLDRTTTGQDRIQTGLDRTAVAADKLAADSAKVAAEAARDAANTSGRCYTAAQGTAAALADAAVLGGQTFAVVSADLLSYTVYRKDAGPVATPMFTQYTKGYFDAFLPDLSVDPQNVPLVCDQAGNVALWLAGGALGAKGLTSALLDAIAGSSSMPFQDVDSGAFITPLIVDAAGKVPVWLDTGNLDAKGFGATLSSAVAASIASALAAKRFAPLAGPLNSPRCISTDGRSLYAWRSKLAKLTRGVTLTQAKVVIMGDSWAEKVAIPQALADYLYALYGGKSGEGWIGLFDEAPLNGVTFANSGWTVYDGSNTVAPPLGCGFDGKALSTTNNTATYSLGNLTTTDLDIYYRKGNGTFRYRVDGGAWTAVTGDGSNTVGKATISGLSNSAHTVEIDTTGNAGTAVLYGFRARRPAVAGIELSKAGNGSLTGKDLSLYAGGNTGPFMLDIQPDLVIVVLGTNDYRLSEDTPAEYTAALSTLVTQVRAASANTGFLFVAPADSSAAPVRPLSDYRDALYEFCVTNGHEFYNMNEDWSSFATMNALGMWADTLHLNPDGAQLFARRVHTRLLSL